MDTGDWLNDEELKRLLRQVIKVEAEYAFDKRSQRGRKNEVLRLVKGAAQRVQR